MSGPAHRVRTRIWHEEPEPDNEFATRSARCHGYDVYGDMLGAARWADMLFLLLRGEAPTPRQVELLEILAVALANPGPRDPAVHAAMCAGASGATAAAMLMAALAVGAGRAGGAREVFHAMQLWQAADGDSAACLQQMRQPPEAVAAVWPEGDHSPGFDPHGLRIATVVQQTLHALAARHREGCLAWLCRERATLEAAAGRPLAMSGVAAAAFADLGLSPEQGEMLYLLLRLPGAAAHALEQQSLGYRDFPLFELDLVDDAAESGR